MLAGAWAAVSGAVECGHWPQWPTFSPCDSRPARPRSRRIDTLQAQVIQPINGDPFVGSLETPVTSSPLVVSYLSSLPAYRTGVAPVQRGVEIGLAHGFLVAGPFIKVGCAAATSSSSRNLALVAQSLMELKQHSCCMVPH